jgi:rare lipoprotein A
MLKYKSIFVILLLLTSTQVQAKPHKQVKHTVHHKMIGAASWYSYQKGNPSHKTASGEKFNPSKHTAAHRTLPFGTKVKVTNIRNNKSVIVTITDRGPFVKGRIIDLSKSSARTINMTGVDSVRLKILPG